MSIHSRESLTAALSGITTDLGDNCLYKVHTQTLHNIRGYQVVLFIQSLGYCRYMCRTPLLAKPSDNILSSTRPHGNSPSTELQRNGVMVKRRFLMKQRNHHLVSGRRKRTVRWFPEIGPGIAILGQSSLLKSNIYNKLRQYLIPLTLATSAYSASSQRAAVCHSKTCNCERV